MMGHDLTQALMMPLLVSWHDDAILIVYYSINFNIWAWIKSCNDSLEAPKHSPSHLVLNTDQTVLLYPGSLELNFTVNLFFPRPAVNVWIVYAFEPPVTPNGYAISGGADKSRRSRPQHNGNYKNRDIIAFPEPDSIWTPQSHPAYGIF